MSEPQPDLNALIGKFLHAGGYLLCQVGVDVRKSNTCRHDRGNEDSTRALQVRHDLGELRVIVLRGLDLRVPPIGPSFLAYFAVDGSHGALVGRVGQPSERHSVLA